MKSLKELMHGITGVMEILRGRMRRIEGNVASQERRLNDIESAQGPTLHAMEVEHLHSVDVEEVRRDAMTNGELRTDLESQYGFSKWAKKLIDGIVSKRA
jgi:hypothetical protein